MKFGHLDEIAEIDFSMPADHPITAKVLKGKPTKKPRIFAGLPEWGNEKFPGKIYPKGTKPKDYLKFYGPQFNAVELNATGYRVPTVKTVEGWVKTVPKDFIFCPKVSQPISQVRPLGRDPVALKQFLEAMKAFGEHLGVVFLQLHPTFAPVRFDDLVNFFDLWNEASSTNGAPLPLHVELRHPGWFADRDLFDRLFEEMRLRGIGTVITDTAGRRDAVHQCLTNKTAFIRFDGNELHPTDFTRLDWWAEHLREWFDRGLETAYVFFHTPTKSLTPEQNNHFIKRINELCGLDLKPAKIQEQSPDLILL